MFKKNEFKAELTRREIKLDTIANMLQIDVTSLYRKMNGVSDFYRNEIEQLAKFLNLSADDIMRIFFAP